MMFYGGLLYVVQKFMDKKAFLIGVYFVIINLRLNLYHSIFRAGNDFPFIESIQIQGVQKLYFMAGLIILSFLKSLAFLLFIDSLNYF